MRILCRLPLGARLALAPLVCCLLMLGMAAASLHGAGVARRALSQVTTETTPSQLLALDLRAAILRSQSLTYRYLSASTAAFTEAQLAEVQRLHAEAGQEVRRLATAVAGEAGLVSSVQGYLQLIDGVVDIARDDQSFAATEMVKAERAFVALSRSIDGLNEQRGALSRQAVAGADGAMTLAERATAAAAVLSLLVAVAISWFVRQAILRQVSHIAESSRRLRAGDLSTVPTVEGDDVIARTSRDLVQTVQTLRTMMGAIARSTAQIDGAIDELASGNEDFSARTETAAASLQQAASEMQVLAQQVGANADDAAQAARIAIASRDAAQRGGSAVQEVVRVMGEISESAHRIGDITGVIDGIAFQTNILALNAAVEAARAGEHGRGFAVVAAEVRALSKRCGEAASQIRRLIGNSVERVQTGAARVDQAGRSIDEIVTRAQELSSSVERIAASAQAQSSHIHSVAQSIGEQENATQQNAALVEQAAAAAGSVRVESHRLLEAVQSFRLS